MYKVVVHNRAARYLKRLPLKDQKKIKFILDQLSMSPFTMSGIKAMMGEWQGYFRLRIGDTRVIFEADSKEQIIYIEHIGPRGDIY